MIPDDSDIEDASFGSQLAVNQFAKTRMMLHNKSSANNTAAPDYGSDKGIDDSESDRDSEYADQVDPNQPSPFSSKKKGRLNTSDSTGTIGSNNS